MIPSLILSFLITALDPLAEPPHMVWAERLIRDLQPRHNSYGSRPTVLQWQGVNGAATTINRTVCSTFVIRLFRQAYGYSAGEMRDWFGSASPTARQVAQAIRSARRFERITTIKALRRGDLIAIDYQRQPSLEVGQDRATGHVMLAAAAPQALPGGRDLPGRQHSGDQWLGLRVIDSSRSGHGPGDSRAQPDGSWGAGGVGRGTIGLLVDREGRIKAYRWSLLPRSRLMTQQQHALVVGRFCPGPCPAEKRPASLRSQPFLLQSNTAASQQ